MSLAYARRTLVVVISLVLSTACNGGSSSGGAGGGLGGQGGNDGMGGFGGSIQAAIAGLWGSQSDDLSMCFYVRSDGEVLTRDGLCATTDGDDSFALEFETIGRTDQDQPCGFSISYGPDVPIDRSTGAFGATFTEPVTGAEVAFSGEIVGLDASGVASRTLDGTTCRVGWAASRASPCNEDAINACLDLQDCCRAILVNPVFFEACNSVVLQCNQAQCMEVLAGYVQCAGLEL